MSTTLGCPCLYIFGKLDNNSAISPPYGGRSKFKLQEVFHHVFDLGDSPIIFFKVGGAPSLFSKRHPYISFMYVASLDSYNNEECIFHFVCCNLALLIFHFSTSAMLALEK